MPRLIAIASADWHIHKFRAFDFNNSRLNNSIKAAKIIIDKAIRNNVPLLFAGDLLHNPKEIENETNREIQKLFYNSGGLNFISISGNHDQCEKNSLERSSPSHLEAIPSIHVLKTHGMSISDMYVQGVPYMNSDKDLKSAIETHRKKLKKINTKFKVLMLHTDMPGAKTSEGFEVKETEYIPNNLDEFFKDWDLVICGHIHRPQQLSKKVYMLGSPIHQNQGDQGIAMGYWEIYDNRKIIFIPLEFPKFIKLKKGEVSKQDGNYYIEFNEVLEDEDVEIGEFNMNKSKGQLAKQYCKIKGIKTKNKKRALIKILNSTE